MIVPIIKKSEVNEKDGNEWGKKPHQYEIDQFRL